MKDRLGLGRFKENIVGMNDRWSTILVLGVLGSFRGGAGGALRVAFPEKGKVNGQRHHPRERGTAQRTKETDCCSKCAAKSSMSSAVLRLPRR